MFTSSIPKYRIVSLLQTFMPMALHDLLPFLLILFHPKVSSKHVFSCNNQIRRCNASLYYISGTLSLDQIASNYSVSPSQINPIKHLNKKDYLISVPCSCQNISGTVGYFYNTSYYVKEGDIFFDVSSQIYNGQAWSFGNEANQFNASTNFPIYLMCGCVANTDQIVVTYTIQPSDTLGDISTTLSAYIDGIQSMNGIENSNFIQAGDVLYVPREINGIPNTIKGSRHKWTIIVAILSTVTLITTFTLCIIIRQKRSGQSTGEDPKYASKSMSTAHRAFSIQNHHLNKENMEDVPVFESERPLIYALEEIEDATNSFHESKKIGEGGFGSVYFGVLGQKEVAIKKMRSNKSKEFLAELKVLCKIHHINVVELLGYASGEDHLYLVYEYVPNGSLSDHLHDPLSKGHQPLGWTARTQIALDAAKGLEYFHDHTKDQYVHRDIKTSNILLDEGLRAKVSDFGLAKLVGRANDEELIATRLVGTPGYLPPESVKELQVTPKTDVFAFGVVLAELITGQRAIIRDKQEPTKVKSLITLIDGVFRDEDPEIALQSIVDRNLQGSYPMEDVYRMAEVAEWCLSEDPVNRPEMREIVVKLSQIVVTSVEWEATLGGNSQIFSGIFNGR